MSQQNINLTEYQKMAAELESSVYRQEEAIKSINHYIEQNNPQRKYNDAIQQANWIKSHLPKEKDHISNFYSSK